MNIESNKCCICKTEDDPSDPDNALETEQHRAMNLSLSSDDCTTFFHRGCFRQMHAQKRGMRCRTECGVCQSKYSFNMYERCGIDVYSVEKEFLDEMVNQICANVVKIIVCMLFVFHAIREFIEYAYIVYFSFVVKILMMRFILNLIGGTVLSLSFGYGAVLFLKFIHQSCMFLLTQAREQHRILFESPDSTCFFYRRLCLEITCLIACGIIILWYVFLFLCVTARVVVLVYENKLS